MCLHCAVASHGIAGMLVYMPAMSLCHHLVALICLYECLLCPSFTSRQSGQDCLNGSHVPVFPFFVLGMLAHMYVCHVLALTHRGLGLPVLTHTVSHCRYMPTWLHLLTQLPLPTKASNHASFPCLPYHRTSCSGLSMPVCTPTMSQLLCSDIEACTDLFACLLCSRANIWWLGHTCIHIFCV